MSRPSSSCIFGSSGPVEVSERGSYIVGILLCFLKKLAGSRTYPPEPDHIYNTDFDFDFETDSDSDEQFSEDKDDL